MEPNGQETAGIQTFVDFNPSHLHVTQVTPDPASPLNVTLTNRHDNSQGTIDFAAGVFTAGPTTTFILATVTFVFAQCADDQATNLIFSIQSPRKTIASIGGEELQRELFGSAITIDSSVPACTGVPSLSQWGLIAMAGLLAAVFAWWVRRNLRREGA